MEILRDQYLDYMTFRSVDRPLFVELFGPLVGLEEQWREQGATEEQIELRAFGFDYVRRHGVNVNTGMQGGFEPEVLEETEDYVLKRDGYGRTVKLCKGVATIALPQDYPVTDMESWEKVKPHYQFSQDRFGDGWIERAKEARSSGALIVASIPGGYDEPRQLMGEERACMAYYQQPELMHDILNTIGETAQRVLERVSDRIQIDQLSVHEDFAGKSGPLVGPKQVEDFIGPYYRRVWDMLQSRGASLFQQDSDGYIEPVLDSLMEAGLNSSLPMEPAAGMDIVKMRKKYGDELAMLGGIDKHVIRRSREEIREELEYKLQPMMQRSGGTVFGLDHRIPTGTPFELYKYYVHTAREMLGLDPDPEPGWGRMAF
ncbi:MAG: uroporphyrinogen decarboxylase family protein [Candidatus Brocadiia bacterium]